MRVIVDAFGGDNAPLEILKGCAMAVQEYGVDIIACGSERVICFLPPYDAYSRSHNAYVPKPY